MTTSLLTFLEHDMGHDEGTRLTRTRHGRMELLARYLPAPPARILDVGGGTGVHAIWLAERGYEVHLIDPVPLHVERARVYNRFTVAEGDARDLAQPDCSADVVLLLGPPVSPRRVG
jgi:ubiquinone/menaquinone biosynthesis C-methylase UbiE